MPKRKENKKSEEVSVEIGGEKNIPYKLSSCCKPKISDDIVAFVTKSNMVSIHKRKCKLIKNVDRNRFLDVEIVYNDQKTEITKYQVGLLLEINERPAYIKDVVEILDQNKVTIVDFAQIKREVSAVYRRLVIDIYDEKELQAVVDGLSRVSGVLKVSRL
ncbi:hypothetical protein GF376_02195 [Candidatus Peregrinibacteria bacterium]|nr:hypothetical protein [Candidatus Peregrinibacteria bacterium]